MKNIFLLAGRNWARIRTLLLASRTQLRLFGSFKKRVSAAPEHSVSYRKMCPRQSKRSRKGKEFKAVFDQLQAGTKIAVRSC